MDTLGKSSLFAVAKVHSIYSVLESQDLFLVL